MSYLLLEVNTDQNTFYLIFISVWYSSLVECKLCYLKIDGSNPQCEQEYFVNEKETPDWPTGAQNQVNMKATRIPYQGWATTPNPFGPDSHITPVMCLPAIRSGPYNFQSSGISTEEICYKTFVVMGQVIYIVHTGFGIVIEKNTIVYLNILSLLPHYMKCISTEHQCYNCGKLF